MAKETVQLDQRKLLERLERLEKQLAKRNEDRGGGVGATLKAFAVGALVGGGVALLYAPQRGEQTRQRVLQVKEQATQLAGQAKEQATQVAGQAQQAASQIKDQAQQSVGQLKDQVQSTTVKPPAPAPPAAVQPRQGSTSGRENPA
jgi:gas vesicle protein